MKAPRADFRMVTPRFSCPAQLATGWTQCMRSSASSELTVMETGLAGGSLDGEADDGSGSAGLRIGSRFGPQSRSMRLLAQVAARRDPAYALEMTRQVALVEEARLGGRQCQGHAVAQQ